MYVDRVLYVQYAVFLASTCISVRSIIIVDQELWLCSVIHFCFYSVSEVVTTDDFVFLGSATAALKLVVRSNIVKSEGTDQLLYYLALSSLQCNAVLYK